MLVRRTNAWDTYCKMDSLIAFYCVWQVRRWPSFVGPPPPPPPQHSQVKRNRFLVKLWVQWGNKMASGPANRKLDSYNKVVVKNLNIYMKCTLIVWPLLRLKEATMKRSSIQHSFCHSLLSYHSSRTFFHHLFLQEHIFDSWEITVYVHM